MVRKVLSLEQATAHAKKLLKTEGDPTLIEGRPKRFYGTGIKDLDFALGGGEILGFPAGHVSEIYGMEASGKTTLAYRVIAQAQRQFPDLVHILFDYENTTDQRYIQACGVEFVRKKLRVFRPDTAEQGIELLTIFMNTGELGVVVFDSLAAMEPKKQIEKHKAKMGESIVGIKAKFMSAVLRNLVPELKKTQVAVLFVNHMIANIGTMSGWGGPSRTTPGGDALKFYAALRCQLTYKGAINEEQKTHSGEVYKARIGKLIELNVDKNKFGNPGHRVRFPIMAGEGIDDLTPLIAAGYAAGEVEKDGAQQWWIKGQSNKIKGAFPFREWLKKNQKEREALQKKVGVYSLTPAEVGIDQPTEVTQFENLVPESPED